MDDVTGSASWSFDTRGQLVAETRSVYGVSGSFRTEWSYNSAGLLKWMKYPAGNNGQVGEQVSYAYHPQLSLNTVMSNAGYAYVNSTSYDEAGRVKQRTLGGTANQVQTQYNYYPWDTQGGRLEWLKSGLPSSDPTKFQYFSYDYDEVGNVSTISDYKLGDPQTGEPQLQSFEYDSLYRLISAGATGGYQGAGNYGPEAYSYELITGRMASKNGVSYTYGSGHFHAVSALSNGSTYSYDANGNMTYRHVYEGGTWKNYTLVYDAENRLATVTRPVTANFKYDGDNKRIRATINGGLDTVFIGNYFEWNVATQTKRTYYFAGATRIAMREGSTDPQWILGDHLGSTSKMVSYAGADTGGQWYKAWGETRLTTGSIPTKYQYTGQYNQVIIGLYYYGARWYDPALGRWTQPDILVPNPSNSTDLDRFAYARNNPVRYNDPNGHCAGDPNQPDSLTKDEKECWRLYNNFSRWYPNITLGSHEDWNAHTLTNLLRILGKVRNAFGGLRGFINGFGNFTILGPTSFGTYIFDWYTSARAAAPPLLRAIYLPLEILYASDFEIVFLHELGHIFDFNNNLSKSFADTLGLSCTSPGLLGCASEGSTLYPSILGIVTGTGDNPVYPGETTWLGSQTSVDDFAESFAAAILSINQEALPSPLYLISQSRIILLISFIHQFHYDNR